MKISARVENSKNHHHILLSTNDQTHSISIPAKASGFGSSANGGELLFLALATCYCNDIYREAAKQNISVTHVEVEVDGEFGGVGEPARNVVYRAKVKAEASEEEVIALLKHTDTVSEIQNSLRQAIPIQLTDIKLMQD